MSQKFHNHLVHQAQFFKLLSDPTRLALLHLLKDGKAQCVCDLHEQLNSPQPTVSRHLNRLKSARVLQAERRGTWMWYSLNHDMPKWQQLCLNTVLACDV